ncbi:EamA family transporter [Clavibacter nebraskensis]|uniref:Permease, DMT family n=2 Tax=Clavibacter nebraskensis TaxID=31963 RepID=A0AAI9EJL7_9MICO|nr:EamA family transporter [Clavibacter nebraskensis]QGV68020.2 EamA family transporter [Clavibacter nebraskensis]QGV70817.2 EamA family transporter [Clavibacter nebraskensis]QGV73609.2 EamA family transporter [Clavibacter nebraskensis]UQB05531.1 EamA family transporter [Clavibacter nebraskensis]UQB08354.1 EamA family transporter [Clavibacter nebraskensis]
MSTAGSDRGPAPRSGSTPAALEGAIAGAPGEPSAAADPGARTTAAGAALQVGTIVSVSYGSSLAGLVIPAVGPVLVVAARQVMMAALVLPVARPRIHRMTRAQLVPAVMLGLALSLMNLSYYAAVDRLGLGIAATIEFLGPLSIALLASRRLLDAACALVAAAGVVVLTGLEGRIDAFGLVCGATAAVTWAGYIVFTRRVAERLPGFQGIAVASIVSLVVLVPWALLTLDVAALDGRILGLLVAIGLLSSAVPYSLDTVILRRITPRLFAVLTSLSPVVAAVLGVIVLRETLSPMQLGAIVVVCVAAGVAIATRAPADAQPRTRSRPAAS